jgi:cytochrome c biogenesis protein ResB
MARATSKQKANTRKAHQLPQPANKTQSLASGRERFHQRHPKGNSGYQNRRQTRINTFFGPSDQAVAAHKQQRSNKKQSAPCTLFGENSAA